ncbi:MAG: DUF116 domain-containing protein [Candidatus Latescibacteria bacterium]|nr:DUF116 domain-containing protein [bacterium]MBD3423037.1 DUF116 domain-containing protein [Candidatus Latescibacterota bacterium]
MKKEKRSESGDKKDRRVLGDQWLDWNGEPVDEEINEGRRTFLLLASLILAGLVLLSLLLLYLVLPRFKLFGSVWAAVITAAVIISALALIIWYLILALKVVYRRRYLKICLDRKNRLLFFLLPYVIKLASFLGISGDRLGHSFIQVNNSLAFNPDRSGNLLVLLPRCLDREIMKEIKEKCEQYTDVEYYSTAGGSAARKLVVKTSPRAIIAVACERDLLSGIQFVSGEIPVIGIPNKRPKGPCKNTVIDTSEFETALKYFHSGDSGQ